MGTDLTGGECHYVYCGCTEESPSLQACSGCHKVEYCSPTCQKEDWKIHRLFCLPPSKLTSADRLALAAFKDIIPEDPDVLCDFGFARTQLQCSKNWLLGLFQGMIKHGGIDLRNIHKERLAGTLVEYIKKFYEPMPVDARGSYYPWFLKNQHLLAPPKFLDTFSIPTDNSLQHAWWFIGGPVTRTLPQIKAELQTWPKEKQQCFSFVQMLLHAGFQLSPDHSEWIYFGFCGCDSPAKETKLWAAYVKLIGASSFDQFYAAYNSCSLPTLFSAHGLPITNPFILDVLGGTTIPNAKKSVWKLKQFVLGDYQGLVPSVTSDYGFMNCRAEEEIYALKQVYRCMFTGADTNPLKLHEACLRGKLLEYARQVTQVGAEVAPLMKNMYPLQNL